MKVFFVSQHQQFLCTNQVNERLVFEKFAGNSESSKTICVGGVICDFLTINLWYSILLNKDL